jgi:DNA-binding NtrC family response regulator
VPLLAEHFLVGIAEQEGKVKRFTPGALKRLSEYRWPGNVRELRNAVQRAYVMVRGDLVDEEWLPQELPGAGVPAAPSAAPAAPSARPAAPAAQRESAGETVTVTIGSSMAEVERAVILATLRHYQHHKERTAAVLGISLKTLYNRLKEYAAEAQGEPPTR